MHWDDDWARSVGSPMAYDYGYIRECCVFHFLADWCGDDGIVLRMDDEMRKFAYIGDTQTLTGEVVGKSASDGQNVVDVLVRMTNQRGETTATATATIALPSRAGVPALYPEPPRDLQIRAIDMMTRHHALKG
jgi:acyl dehydratase